MKKQLPIFLLFLLTVSPQCIASDLNGWSISHPAGPKGPMRMDQTLALKTGEMAVVRVSASAPQETKMEFEGTPPESHYPQASSQTFTLNALPTEIAGILPADVAGEYHLKISADKPFAVHFLGVTVKTPDWLKDHSVPSLHTVATAPLPARWSNAEGKYLSALGGTVAFQMTPDWITDLKGGRGGLFDAYVALRMTADRNTLTTYFMIQPPGTDADNVTWERSHWKLDQPLVIGDAPDTGWAKAVARFDDGKSHFLAFTWKQFRENDTNYLYTSYFVDDRPFNARVTLLGDQSVAPDPKSVYLGSLGGQPTGYDPSPPAPMGIQHFLLYKEPLSPQGLLSLRQQLLANAGPAITAGTSDVQKVTDSRLPNRVLNGRFELGSYGWGGRFIDTIDGHPHGSWHGQPGTSIGVNEVWKAHGGQYGKPGLVFNLPLYSGKPLESDWFVLPPSQRFNLTELSF